MSVINHHDFQQAARHFRSGRLSLSEFTSKVFGATSAAERRFDEKKGGYVLPVRGDDSHKGDFGRVLAVGGSVGMAGAIALTAQAAMRTGSGLVRVITPSEVRATVGAFSPCLMVVPAESVNGCFASTAQTMIDQHAEWSNVVALGPGMGRSEPGQALVRQLYEERVQPMVVDADGLNNLADAKLDWSAHRGPRILTPHAGEFQRLVGETFRDRSRLEARAVQFAEDHQLTLILKGSRSLVTDGRQKSHNKSGNSGMATAGTGDVLTGIVASLLGQGLSCLDAADTGCYLHGLAGDIAAKQLGKASMIATDLLDALPQSLQTLENAN